MAKGQVASEEAFNETLKRMLSTPPMQHDNCVAAKSQAKKWKSAKASPSLPSLEPNLKLPV